MEFVKSASNFMWILFLEGSWCGDFGFRESVRSQVADLGPSRSCRLVADARASSEVLASVPSVTSHIAESFFFSAFPS